MDKKGFLDRARALGYHVARGTSYIFSGRRRLDIAKDRFIRVDCMNKEEEWETECWIDYRDISMVSRRYGFLCIERRAETVLD